MSENYERFKNLTAGIQSIVFAVAFAVGGIWTIYTFSILGTREKAKAEIDKDKAAFETAKLEQERQANFGLDISIDAKQERLVNNNGHYISALVKITNKGLQNRFIDFRESPLFVVRVEFDGEGHSHRSPRVLTQNNILSESIVLRTGTTVSYPLLVEVAEKGFYFLSFQVELNKEEMETHKQSGGPDKGTGWVGNSYVLVN